MVGSCLCAGTDNDLSNACVEAGGNRLSVAWPMSMAKQPLSSMA